MIFKGILCFAVLFLIILLSGCNSNPLESKLTNSDLVTEVATPTNAANTTTNDSVTKPKPPVPSPQLTPSNKSTSTKTIYSPKAGTSWQWQLSGTINTNYKVDLYDVDLVNTPQSVIDELHKKGIKVICYFSAGSVDIQRADAKDFPKEVVGNILEGWEDERWLDVSNYQKFATILQKRMDLAVKKQCDGIEPDNVDSYENDPGFNVKAEDQLEYNIWLAKEAHKRGLAIALKNDLDQIKDLVNYFDFAVNEQCFQYDECEELTKFTAQNKAVLGVEYELSTKKFCKKANDLNFSWLKLTYDLAGKRVACN